MGNDVILYDYAGDSLIIQAEETDYEVISSLQYDVKDLVGEYPETAKYFSPDSYNIYDFSNKPWEVFKGYSPIKAVADMQMYDIQNLCLYKRGVFDKIGYTDANFFPAYFIDNDYARRIVISGIKCCTLVNARFFHFWSRTIKQGEGGSTAHYFENNKRYYNMKWGGDFGHETKTANIKIDSRNDEYTTVNYWKGL